MPFNASMSGTFSSQGKFYKKNDPALPQVTDGLIAYYKFENNLNDSSGNNRTLSVVKDSISYNSTQLKTGLAYTPNSSSVVSGTFNSLPSGNSARSLSCWVYFNSGQTQRSLIFGTGSFGIGNANFDLEINGYAASQPRPGWITVHWWGNGNYVWQGADIITDKWTHFTLTHNGGNLNSTNTKLYVDGIQQGSYDGDTSLNTSSTHKIMTGGRFYDSYSDLFWSGGIDNMMYFNRALSQQEVTNLYKNRNNQYSTQSVSEQNYYETFSSGLSGYYNQTLAYNFSDVNNNSVFSPTVATAHTASNQGLYFGSGGTTSSGGWGAWRIVLNGGNPLPAGSYSVSSLVEVTTTPSASNDGMYLFAVAPDEKQQIFFHNSPVNSKTLKTGTFTLASPKVITMHYQQYDGSSAYAMSGRTYNLTVRKTA